MEAVKHSWHEHSPSAMRFHSGALARAAGLLCGRSGTSDIVGEWTPIRSQAKVKPECLVELMQQRKVQVPYEGPDAVDIDRADLFGVGLRRLA